MNLVIFVVGVFVGALLFYIFVDHKKPSGTFIIDCSDPLNENLCTLNLHESLDAIWDKKKIVVNVKTYSNDSHE